MEETRYYESDSGLLQVEVHDMENDKARVTVQETKGRHKEGDEMLVQAGQLKRPDEIN